MTKWIEPIVDRSEEDLQQRTHKAFCNLEDVNRLEENMAWLGKRLGVSTNQKEWQRTDFLTEAVFSRWETLLKQLRKAGTVETQEVPEAPWTTLMQWNAAEQILSDLHEAAEKEERNFSYAGELWSCEQGGGILE